MAALFVAAACNNPSASKQTNGSSGRAILNSTTAAEIVASFTKAGLPVANAHDVTQSKCPTVGCLDAVDSDTVSVLKFGSTGAAQRFAGSTPEVYQIEDVVLVFTAGVPADQKSAYQDVARTAVAS